MNTEITPFDDIRNLVNSIPSADDAMAFSVRESLANTMGGLKPLGRLSEAVAWLSGWQHNSHPNIQKPLVAVFIASHDIARKVSGGDPVKQAQQRVGLVSEGKTAVRGIASSQGAAFKIYEMGITQPALDFSVQASLSEKECAQAIAFGMEVVSEGADIIALGSAGVGTATAAASIARGLYGGAASYWAGGTQGAAEKRIKIVEQAAHMHKDILHDPLQVLRHFGGRDIAGLVGAILAARHQKIPILLDGFAVCSAAAILHALNPRAIDHCMAAHITSEPAHGALLDRIKKRHLLELELGVGDGSGAALAIGVLKAATVSNKDL